SSHLLGEVQQMVDVVGIIAAGRLIREGPIEEVLDSEGTVRVRVAPADLQRAIAVLGDHVGPELVATSEAEPGWISVRRTTDRIGEIKRPLAGAGIWAIGLEPGNDLEMLFLELTRGEPVATGEGTFFGT